MAQLNFPDPNFVQEYEAGGLKWTWNATHQVWSAEMVSDSYLSSTEDDTAAGAITFEGQTTHEAGLTVTGGTLDDVNTGFFYTADNQQLNVAVNGTNPLWIRDGSNYTSNFTPNVVGNGENAGYGIVLSGTYTGSVNNVCYGVRSQMNYSGLTTPVFTHFSAAQGSGSTGSDNIAEMRGFTVGTSIATSPKNIAFHSDLATNPDRDNYSFYASGNAQNYFGGNLKIASSPDKLIGVNNFDVGLSITATNGLLAINRSGGTGSANPCVILRRTNGSSTGGWRAIEMYNHDNSSSGFLKISGATTRVIDSRLGATGVAMPDGAAEIVKALQPKVITQGGETFNGFLPADLVGTFAAAVDGDVDATVAIGTYTDPDGNVETDVEEPEAIPFGGSWEQTGTRDLMQGVSRGELIPLLTKALQEALTRIEALEAQVGGTN